MNKYLFFVAIFRIFFWFVPGTDTLLAQDPARLEKEVLSFDTVDFKIDPAKPIVVFTGSSSIRKWEDLQKMFPEVNVINTGFGGSHMNDLLFYADPLIIRYKPSVVFIYEGDNDIAEGKSPKEVFNEMVRLVRKLTGHIPGVQLVFISVKPAPSRWEFSEQYRAWNKMLEDFCESHAGISFVDVWDVMLDHNHGPDSTLYIRDMLHLNNKGYEIWTNLFRIYLDD